MATMTRQKRTESKSAKRHALERMVLEAVVWECQQFMRPLSSEEHELFDATYEREGYAAIRKRARKLIKEQVRELMARN